MWPLPPVLCWQSRLTNSDSPFAFFQPWMAVAANVDDAPHPPVYTVEFEGSDAIPVHDNEVERA